MPRSVLCLALACLAGFPAPAAAAGIFPALRKRLEAQKQLSLSQNATASSPVAATVVEVPSPVDVGADGFPALPPVDQILGGATRTLRTVSSQANDIVGRMASEQKQSEAGLNRQKRAFEGQLKSQEMKNQLVAAGNKKITADIENLKTENVDLRKQAHSVQKKNAMLRSVVHSLDSKVTLAKDFAQKSLAETDDSKQSVLKVLQDKSHGPDDDFLRDDRPSVDDDDDDDDEHEGTSLLALSSSVRKIAAISDDFDLEVAPSSESPDSILSMLSKDVNSLVQQHKQSVTNLKNLFIRDYRAGAKRHLALLNQQKVLNAQLDVQEALRQKLQSAVAHLQGTHSKLGHRLRGLGQFLQKLVHVANAPEAEVPNLLGNLPKTVIAH